MQNEIFLKSIYSDGTKYFVSNPLPKKGEKITISIQMLNNPDLKAVYLRGKLNGVESPIKMELFNYDFQNEKSVNYNTGLLRFCTKVQLFEKEFSYSFIILTKNCIYYYNQEGIFTYITDESRNFRILTDYQQPEWVKNAVFYQIFPERFCNGNPKNDVKDGEYIFDGFPCKKVKDWNSIPEPYDKSHCLDFYGGDLEGIKQKIPYLKKLGVTALYLNPIFYAATVHKYDCLDYFQVDPHFGGNKALSELVEELHKNGMKIILDVSINHTGTANKWFNKEGSFFPKNQGAYNNPQSLERNFYFFNKDNSYKCWFDVPTLPTLNYTSKDLCKKIFASSTSLVKKWLKAPFNTDGWRFDVADVMARNNEIQLHHEIWPKIRKSIKDENPNAYILAEDWTDCSEFLNGNEWDSTMNYYASCRPIRQFYGQSDIFTGRVKEISQIPYKMTAKDLSNHITGFLSRLPYVIVQVQFNLIDSHDVPRFHNDKLMSKKAVRGAVTMLFTLPGCTNIYYGDEAEIDGTTESMEDCRYPMPWSKDIEAIDSYKLYSSLAKIKTQNKAFCDGGFKILYDEGYIFAFARFTLDELFITICSTEEKNKTIELPVGIFGKRLLKSCNLSEDLLGKKVNAKVKNGVLKVEVKKESSYLLKL